MSTWVAALASSSRGDAELPLPGGSLAHSVSEEMLREELELAKLGALKTSCPLMFPALDPKFSHLMVFGGNFYSA